jgi:hypothetical protein
LATPATDLHGSALHRAARARLAQPVGLAAAAGVGALALHLRDPHTSGSWGFCPIRLITGLQCPGCGGLRAVNDLTNLDLAAAASSNLLFVAMIPLIVGFWLLWVRNAAAGRDRPRVRWTPALLTAVLSVVVTFTVLRNLAIGSWLAP